MNAPILSKIHLHIYSLVDYFLIIRTVLKNMFLLDPMENNLQFYY